MNLCHRILCRSGAWRQTLEAKIFPWVFEGVDLRGEVLDIGPGPGLTTDLLRSRVDQLTVVEIDPSLAASLTLRMAGTNVIVLQQDATAMQIPSASFDGAVCFTMLHHVPSPALQDKLIHEVARVLRPGAFFAGYDSLFRSWFDPAHLFDTNVPIDPEMFPGRLRSAGFENITIQTKRHGFRFIAQKP